MGGTYIAEAAPGATAEEALEALRAAFRERGYTDADDLSGEWDDNGPEPWPDPFAKGYVQVWDKPVKDYAADWMRGWTAQHPPDGVDPDDKWGPWMTFPLESGGWMFFGWVNT